MCLNSKQITFWKFGGDYNYQGEFGSNRIAGPPYEKVFESQYCRIYAARTPTYGFGGLGFVSIELLFKLLQGFPILLNINHPIKYQS